MIFISTFQQGQRRSEKGAGSREVVEGKAAEEKGDQNKAGQREEEEVGGNGESRLAEKSGLSRVGLHAAVRIGAESFETKGG